MRRAAWVAVVLSASAAMAWPVDWIHDVAPGKEKFIKLPRVDWVEVDDPKVVSVEWMEESNELIVTGLKAGRATVLLGADGKVAAWRVRVGGAPVLEPTALPAVQKVCGDVRVTPLEDVKLTAVVTDEACHKAMMTLFQTDAFEARHLDLTLDSKVLQVQLKSVQDGLALVAKGKVKARYVGAGLILEGNVTVAEHRKVLWEVLKRTLGRFALDDQMVLPEPPSDGGTDSAK